MLPEFKTPLVLVLIPILLLLFWYEYQRGQGPSFKFSSLSLMQQIGPTWRVQWSFLPWVLRGVGFSFTIDCPGRPTKTFATV